MSTAIKTSTQAAPENWSLFRVSDRKQFDEVSLETIEFFFAALPPALHVDWLMWREGFQGWRPFSELTQILTHLQSVSPMRDQATPPPVPAEVVKISEKAEVVKISDKKVITLPDEGTLSLMLESQAAIEDRNTARYQKKFKVKIMTSKGPVEMVTIDASVSGFRMREPLPEGLPRFFHVEINLGPDGKIPLVCSAVPEKDGRPATRVRIQVNDNMGAYKSALMRVA